jgi:hypothetical protein
VAHLPTTSGRWSRLDVTGDVMEARERIDAVLQSKDREDVDVELLRAAHEALDGGNRDEAAALLNRGSAEVPCPLARRPRAESSATRRSRNAGRAY